MDFKNITFYPEFGIDAVIYVAVAVMLVLLSKCLWDWKEGRRLRKEMADWQQHRENEAEEQ